MAFTQPRPQLPGSLSFYAPPLHYNNMNTLAELYGRVYGTDSALAANPECVATQNQIKIKIELLEQQKSRGAQVRTRVKWVEEGEKNAKYFLNLDESRAKLKIMERVTDEKRRTFMK